MPEPVPPEMMTLQRTRPMTLRISAPAGEMAPNRTSWSSVSLSFLNFRIVSATPSMANGGAMTLTRDPSSRRASQIGEDSSTRLPTWLTIRWQMFISCALSRKRTLVSWIFPATSMKHRAGPLTMMSAMSSRASSGSSGPKPRTSLQMSSSRSSCSAMDSTRFLIVTISCTISRISSRAASVSSLDRAARSIASIRALKINDFV